MLRRSGFAAGIKAEELTADTLPQLTAWLSAQEKPLEEAYLLPARTPPPCTGIRP